MKTRATSLLQARGWYWLAMWLLCLPAALRAQAPAWQWAIQSRAGAYNVTVNSSAAAPSGDIFVSGNFSGPSATFGALPAVSGVGYNTLSGTTGFLGKLNAGTGQWLWVRAFAGSSSQVVATANGGAAVLGRLRNAITFGGVTLPASPRNNDLFVARCDATGQWQTAWSLPVSGQLILATSSLAPNGDVALGGHFSGAATFGNLPALNAGAAPFFTLFAARSSGQTGQWQWATQATTTRSPGLTTVALAPNGDVVFAGGANVALQFGSLPPLVSTSPNTFFVTRLSASAGQWLWATKADVVSFPQESCLAFTSVGDVVLAGRIAGTVGLGALPALPGTAGSLVLAGLAGSTGQWQWATQTGGWRIPIIPRALAVTSTNEPVVAGTVIDTLQIGPLPRVLSNGAACFVAKMGAQGGPWRWAVVAGPIQRVISITSWAAGANCLSLTAADEPLVGGEITGQVAFSNTTLVGGIAPTDGGSDMFIAQLGAAPLATASPALAAQAQLYPNPATGSFTLRLPAASEAHTTATLLNSLGQIVRQQAVPVRFQVIVVDVRGLAPGLYTVLLPFGHGTISRRVAVQ